MKTTQASPITLKRLSSDSPRPPHRYLMGLPGIRMRLSENTPRAPRTPRRRLDAFVCTTLRVQGCQASCAKLCDTVTTFIGTPSTWHFARVHGPQTSRTRFRQSAPAPKDIPEQLPRLFLLRNRQRFPGPPIGSPSGSLWSWGALPSPPRMALKTLQELPKNF